MKKRNIIIGILVIIIIVLVVIVALSGKKTYQDISLDEGKWENLYYSYINDAKEKNDVYSMAFNSSNGESEIGFIETTVSDKPVMYLLNHSQIEETDSNFDTIYLYIINDKNEVELCGNMGSQDLTLEFIYDIPHEKYDYFVHIDSDDQGQFISVDTIINDYYALANFWEEKKAQNDGKELTDEEESECYQEFEDSKRNNEKRSDYTIYKENTKLTIPRDNNEKIIDLGIEIKGIKYSKDIDDDDLKDMIDLMLTSYKTTEQYATTDAKSIVEQKVNDIKVAKEERRIKGMTLTQDDIQSKLNPHLMALKMVYQGADYGVESVYKTKDVTGSVQVPGTPTGMQVYEVGAISVQSLKDQASRYISENALAQLSKSMWGDYTEYLHDYNNKVYIVRGGIGDGPDLKINNPKLLSSEGNGVYKIQIQDINLLSEEVEATLIITVEYSEDYEIAGMFKITNCEIKSAY